MMDPWTVALFVVNLAVGVLVGVLAYLAKDLVRVVHETREKMARLEVDMRDWFVRRAECADHRREQNARLGALDAACGRHDVALAEMKGGR